MLLTVVKPKGNTMNNTNNNPFANVLKKLEEMGVPISAELKEEVASIGETPVVEYRGPQTKREEKIYNAAEKVLDKTFVGYGKAKEKCKPAIEATSKAVVKSRGWVGGLIKKLGEKIEPKS